MRGRQHVWIFVQSDVVVRSGMTPHTTFDEVTLKVALTDNSNSGCDVLVLLCRCGCCCQCSSCDGLSASAGPCCGVMCATMHHSTSVVDAADDGLTVWLLPHLPPAPSPCRPCCKPPAARRTAQDVKRDSQTWIRHPVSCALTSGRWKLLCWQRVRAKLDSSRCTVMCPSILSADSMALQMCTESV